MQNDLIWISSLSILKDANKYHPGSLLLHSIVRIDSLQSKTLENAYVA